MKQAIIVRTDLKMGKGKVASQVAHASVSSFLKSKSKKMWIDEGMKKIILKVSSLRELKNLYRQAKRDKLPCELIKDRGLTQIKPGSVTCLGIGPVSDKKIDKIIRKLKLL